MKRFFQMFILDRPILSVCLILMCFEMVICAIAMFLLGSAISATMYQVCQPCAYILFHYFEINLGTIAGFISDCTLFLPRYIIVPLIFSFILKNMKSGILHKLVYLLRYTLKAKIIFFLGYLLLHIILSIRAIDAGFIEKSCWLKGMFLYICAEMSIIVYLYLLWYCEDLYNKWKEEPEKNSFKEKYVRIISKSIEIKEKVCGYISERIEKIKNGKRIENFAKKHEAFTQITVTILCQGIPFYIFFTLLYYKFFRFLPKYLNIITAITFYVSAPIYLIMRYLILIKTYDYYANNGKNLFSKLLHFIKFIIFDKFFNYMRNTSLGRMLEVPLHILMFILDIAILILFLNLTLFCFGAIFITISPIFIFLLYYWYLDRKYKDVV